MKNTEKDFYMYMAQFSLIARESFKDGTHSPIYGGKLLASKDVNNIPDLLAQYCIVVTSLCERRTQPFGHEV